ncbi:MAG TPA: hypothetical protein VGP46_12255 [Acidimicrobiales bacterium]|nr:hypothetical protein [Acidimicrobiales bacterium]
MTPLTVAVGLLVVLITGAGMIATVVMPRGRSAPQLIGLVVTRGVRLVVINISKLFSDFSKKDAVLATIGPMAMLVQLLVFLGLFLVGYGIAISTYAGSFGLGLRQAGASLFTVGLAHVGGSDNAVLGIMAAATGAVAIALQIGYLPTIYQAFNRRESLVTLMESRAGLPAWGPEVLARQQLILSTDALRDMYHDWELWAADLAESHVSYPVLMYFRSPEPWYSWILALLAVLDSAAMQMALNPGATPSEARMCLRMGFTALRRIAASLRWPYDEDPLPDADIDLTFDDFNYAIDMLSQIGFPMERTAEEAWPHFKGWRVNYEAIAYRLADRVVAPRAPWSGDRHYLPDALAMPKRPPHRQPDGKVTLESRFRAGIPSNNPDPETISTHGLFGKGSGLSGPRRLRSSPERPKE